MNKTILKNNTICSAFGGVTAAMLIGSYSLCICAAAGLGNRSMLICTLLCTLFSLKNNNKIFAPDVFLIVPMLFVIIKGNIPTLILSITIGSLIFLLLKKILPSLKVPDSVCAGGGLSLALVATVLLTNLYFGIGAFGGTALDMLKSYRSLGFHPNFRGLLYGTVTLFAMITYPFKFKKLNKYLPAEFITLLIPLIMNLFLNPTAELTTINEITVFSNNTFPLLELSNLNSISLSVLFKGSLSFALILFAYRGDTDKNLRYSAVNGASGLLSGIPLREYSVIKYDTISAAVCFALCTAVVLLFPSVLSRIPLHCVGAMLIVSAWQKVPYKKLADSCRKNMLLTLFEVILICLSAVLSGIFQAMLLAFALTFIQEQKNGKR